MSVILLVEDEPDTVCLVRLLLEMEGHQVLSAGTGRDALVSFRKSRPDLMLLDIGLPDIDGWEVIARLGAEQAPFPIIVFSAHTGPTASGRARDLGCAGFLGKPFEPESLINTVRSVLLEEKALLPISP